MSGSVNSIVQTTLVSTGSLSYVDMTDMSITMETGTTILLSYSIPLRSLQRATFPSFIRVCNSDDTIVYLVQQVSLPTQIYDTNPIYITGSQSIVIPNLTPGSNQFKIQWKTGSSTRPTPYPITSDGTFSPRYFSVVTLN